MISDEDLKMLEAEARVFLKHGYSVNDSLQIVTDDFCEEIKHALGERLDPPREPPPGCYVRRRLNGTGK